MATLPTFDELYAVAQAEIQSRNPALTDFEEGSVLDGFTGASAVLADEVARVLVDLFAAQFFSTAAGEDLDDLAADRLGVTRQAAGFATVTLTWTRTSGTYTIPAGTTFAAVNVDGETVTFSTTADVSVVADSTPVVVVADVAGRASNVDVGTITTIVDTVAADPSATVTNAARAAGGSDAWTDAQFREYIKSYYTSLRRGTIPALKVGALTVAGVSIVSVYEAYPVTYVYVGDPDGSGNTALADAVATELENWRAAGSLVTVLPTTREEKTLNLTVLMRTLPADTTTLETDVQTAIVDYGDTLQAGEIAYRAGIVRAAMSADDRILSVSGASNLTPTSDAHAIRFLPSGITITFSLES